ncbi:hypothetical protein B0H14DRAFT_3160808 [Mycena olivaceomarginata]|nr:hypothetical protein B0H14DRAFT_3160808 [Mycena olivaceomarginata]
MARVWTAPSMKIPDIYGLHSMLTALSWLEARPPAAITKHCVSGAAIRFASWWLRHVIRGAGSRAFLLVNKGGVSGRWGGIQPTLSTGCPCSAFITRSRPGSALIPLELH